MSFILAKQGWSEQDRLTAVGRFARLAESGVSREEVNAAYYRGFAGLSRSWVLQQGREWFYQQTKTRSLYQEPVLAELRTLRDDGTVIALVSGSFDGCLSPIAESVGAAHIIASKPIVVDACYTGEVSVPMIGAAKARAVKLLTRSLGLTREQVRAYGDHVSDAPMLSFAGQPVVVGADPDLLRIASSENWRCLSLN